MKSAWWKRAVALSALTTSLPYLQFVRAVNIMEYTHVHRKRGDTWYPACVKSYSTINQIRCNVIYCDFACCCVWWFKRKENNNDFATGMKVEESLINFGYIVAAMLFQFLIKFIERHLFTAHANILFNYICIMGGCGIRHIRANIRYCIWNGYYNLI